MLQSFTDLFKNIPFYYQGIIFTFISGLVTFLLSLIYKKIKNIFYESNILGAYVIVRSLYPPLVVYSWLRLLLTMGYLWHEQGYINNFPTEQMAIMFKLLNLSLLAFISIRFVNTANELFSHYLLRRWKIQPSFARFGGRLLNLGILVILGIVSLHVINSTIVKTLANATTLTVIWSLSLISVYFLHLMETSIKKKRSITQDFYIGNELLVKLINPAILMILGSAALFSVREIGIAKSIFNEYIGYGEIAQLAFFWSLFRITSLIESQFLSGSLTKTTANKTKVQATVNIVRIILALVIILVLLMKYKKGIQNVITLLGGASVALSLAGRDIIANYLSGLVIYSEGQFKVGDWIYATTNDKIQGHIEYIGMRTTSVRTFDKRLLLVPNSFFSSNGIVNASRMTNRRIKKEIPLGWFTSREVIEKIVQEIRLLVYNHPGIDKATLPPMVHLTDFKKSATVITIYALTRTKNWHTYMNVQENILREVKSIIEKNGAIPPIDLMHIESHLGSGFYSTGYDKIN